MTQDQPPSEPTDQSPRPLSEPSIELPVVPEEIAAESLDAVSNDLLDDFRQATPSASAPATAKPAIAHTVQTTWAQAQPVLRTQTIKLLRRGIRVLEGVVQKLEEGAPAPEKSSDGILPPTMENGPGAGVPTPWTANLQQKFQQIWEKVRPYWQRFQAWWWKTLPSIRAILPDSLNRKLSDRALTGVIVGVLVLLLWITSNIFSSKPEPASVAVTPATKSTPNSKRTPPPKVKIPERPKPGAPKSNAAKPAPPKLVAPKPTVSPLIKPAPSSAPTPTPTIAPSPPPPLKLTPEQKLIAQIQDQVAEITNQYVSGLIQSVQANFRVSRLTVKVGEGWYGLTQIQQNNLANELLRRAQQLNFSKLEITDPQSALLARSPVVGTEMIILQRSPTSPSTTANPAT